MHSASELFTQQFYVLLLFFSEIELVGLPLLNRTSLKMLLLLIKPPLHTITQCSHVRAVFAIFFV